MNKKINFAYVLIGCLAFGSAALWVNVFSLFHEGILSYVFGIPVGAGIVGTLARSANILPRVQSKRARDAGWILLGAMVIVEPVVLAFANYPVIMGYKIDTLGGWIIAGGASVVVTITLALGSVVDRSLVSVAKPEKPQGETVDKPRATKKKVARKPISDDNLLRYFAENVGATDTQVAQHFGVTRQAIGKRREKLYSISKEEGK